MTTRINLLSILTPIEFCDRCGVRARVRVVLDDSGELYFCRHHAREYADALRRVAVSLTDVPV
jgi:hypothetical protein